MKIIRGKAPAHSKFESYYGPLCIAEEMVMTREVQQEQEQPTSSENMTAGEGIGQEMGMEVDYASVSKRLRQTDADMRDEPGNKNYPRFTDHYDSQEVIYKNNANQIQTDYPSSIEDRVDWLEKIEMTLAGDVSSIRWMVINKQLPCLVDNANVSFEIHSSYIHYRAFTFDRVIPFSCILSDTREKCVISVLNDNIPYKIMCPERVWPSMFKKIYIKLSLKIPHALRHFHQSINRHNGEALVSQFVQRVIMCHKPLRNCLSCVKILSRWIIYLSGHKCAVTYCNCTETTNRR